MTSYLKTYRKPFLSYKVQKTMKFTIVRNILLTLPLPYRVWSWECGVSLYRKTLIVVPSVKL